jgi:mycofactocin precursor
MDPTKAGCHQEGLPLGDCEEPEVLEEIEVEDLAVDGICGVY